MGGKQDLWGKSGLGGFGRIAGTSEVCRRLGRLGGEARGVHGRVWQDWGTSRVHRWVWGMGRFSFPPQTRGYFWTIHPFAPRLTTPLTQ